MPPFLNDTFTDTNGVTLASHTGETGATWTLTPLGVGTFVIGSNRIHGAGSAVEAAYRASGVAASADYEVEATFAFLTTTGNVLIGITGRMNSAGTAGIRLALNGFNDALELSDIATDTTLHSVAWTTATHTVKLAFSGSSVGMYVDGALIHTQNGITPSAAGFVGVYKYGDFDLSNFWELDSITATDSAANTTSPPIRRRRRPRGLIIR